MGFGDLDRAVESVLTIQSVGAGDTGYYGCKAVNTAGETMLTNHYHLILSPVVQTSGKSCMYLYTRWNPS